MTMSIIALTSAALVGTALMVIFSGLGRLIQSGDSIKNRLEAVSPEAELVEVTGTSSTRKVGRLSGLFNRSLTNRGFAASMATDLARANLSLTVSEYVVLRGCIIAVCVAIPFLFTRQALFALLGALVGFALPLLYVRRRQGQRFVAFQEQLPDMLTLLVGSLRSGYGMTIAMDTVAKNMPTPVSEEFSRVVREIGLGVPMSQAMSNMVRRIRSDDLDLIVTAISIQSEIGGNLGNILETISDTIRERIRLKGQLRTLMSQPMMTRYILTALPIFLGGVIFLMNREYMLGLFLPGPTLIIPIYAGVSLVLGYLVMGALAKIDV